MLRDYNASGKVLHRRSSRHRYQIIATRAARDGPTVPSSPVTYGSVCRASSTPATLESFDAASTISSSRGSSIAGIAAAPWWGNSRRAATSITIARTTRGKCGERYVREEVLAEKFVQVLGRLNFGEDVLQWVSTALRESHADQRKEHDAAIVRLQAECERLQNRIRAMYIDKLDGRVDRSFYAQMSEQWRAEREKLMQEITLHQVADDCYLDEGVRLLELAQSAQRLSPDRSRASSAAC